MSSSESKYESLFSTAHFRKDLKRRSIRGGTITSGAQGFKFILNLGSMMVLARLLAPEEFGLIAMVTAVTNFVALFKDLGLSMATVQKAEINHSQVSTLFWINVAVSTVMMLLVAALAPFIAAFYVEPKLATITLALSVTFIFSGLTIQHQALLRRTMRFSALAAIEITSTVIGVATAIIAAWQFDLGYWSLILMQVVIPITTMLGVWMLCGWRPGPAKLSPEVKTMITFGKNLTGFNIVSYFSRNLDNILIGKFWGADQLGLYSRAYGLLMLPIQQINAPIASVAIPVLSRIRDDENQYRKYYLKILSLIALITIPSVTFMIIMSEELILLIMGAQWIEASRLFMVLGIAALFQPLSNAVGWLFISQNRTREMLQWGVIGSCLAIASILAGLPWGAWGVAVSYAISSIFFRAPLLFWFVGREGPICTIDFYRTSSLPLLSSVCIGPVLWKLHNWITDAPLLLEIALAYSLTIIVTILVHLVFPSGRNLLRTVKEIFGILKGKGSVQNYVLR